VSRCGRPRFWDQGREVLLGLRVVPDLADLLSTPAGLRDFPRPGECLLS